MRFQLWRKTSKVPKGTLGTYSKVGQITSHNESPWDAGSTTKGIDQQVGIDFTTTDHTPIVPGDLLISSGTDRAYRVMMVEINVREAAGVKPWKVSTRQLQRCERFAKHRDYTQCSKRRRKTNADPST